MRPIPASLKLRRAAAITCAAALGSLGVTATPAIAVVDEGVVGGDWNAGEEANPNLLSVFGATGAAITDRWSPLETILITPDLNCGVQLRGEDFSQFYGGTACGTFVDVDETLYGPDRFPGWPDFNRYVPVSQEGPTGDGSEARPFEIVTVVDLGQSGIRVTQRDVYVRGEGSYQTHVEVTNRGRWYVDVNLFRAANCHADSQYGFGLKSDRSVGCSGLGRPGVMFEWETPEVKFAEGEDYEILSVLANGRDFDNTIFSDRYHERGMAQFHDTSIGLNLRFGLAPNETRSFTHRTVLMDANLSLDRDRDALLDEWETEGIDFDGDGVIDVDLPAMGASPDRRDVFVEVDWMTRRSVDSEHFRAASVRSFAPDQAAIDDVVRAFAEAPVGNVGGSKGISLHVDAGPDSTMNPLTGEKWGNLSRAGEVPYAEYLGGSRDENAALDGLLEARRNHFDVNRQDVFHYALFGDKVGGSDGTGLSTWYSKTGGGDSFFVAKGQLNRVKRQESGTFMHQLGHNLGLREGGGDAERFKPNYDSVMNYHWQLGGASLDYSRPWGEAVDESVLVETAGASKKLKQVAWFCPEDAEGTGSRTRRITSDKSAIDWNCDGLLQSEPYALDVNQSARFGMPAISSLIGYQDWDFLKFHGGEISAFGFDDEWDRDIDEDRSVITEIGFDELRELIGPLGDDGSGDFVFEGPGSLLPGVSGQKLRVSVNNIGGATADYTLTATGVPGIEQESSTVTIEGGQAADIDIPVDGSLVVPGRHALSLTLTSGEDGEELLAEEIELLVPDLTNPEALAEIAAARDQLRAGEIIIDATVAERLLASIAQVQLPGDDPDPGTDPDPGAGSGDEPGTDPDPGTGPGGGGTPTPDPDSPSTPGGDDEEGTKPTVPATAFLNDDWTETANTELPLHLAAPGDEFIAGDWDGDGKDSVGIRRRNRVMLWNGAADGDPDVEFTYGRPDDELLIGDWDGNGTDTFAVRRGNTFYLRNELTSGMAEKGIHYGRSGDEVFVGDWDGDDVDTFAVRRDGNRIFVLNSIRSGWADTDFFYGRANEEMYAGDWDGDDVDTFLVRRGTQWLVRNSLTNGWAEKEIVYGREADSPLIGDWDGDRKDTVGVVRFN